MSAPLGQMAGNFGKPTVRWCASMGRDTSGIRGAWRGIVSYGYHGKVLKVDLTTGKIDVETQATFYRRYLGGGALATYYLLSEMAAGRGSPGSRQRAGLRLRRDHRHPGGWLARASPWPPSRPSPAASARPRRAAGGARVQDGRLRRRRVQGRAPKPVYLWIKDGEAELRDAAAIWGQLTGEAQDAIRAELGEPRARIAQIGPAGEKLVRYACVLNELKHANGRTGHGRGDGQQEPARPSPCAAPRSCRRGRQGGASRRLARWVNQTYVPDAMQRSAPPAACAASTPAASCPRATSARAPSRAPRPICGETHARHHPGRSAAPATPARCAASARSGGRRALGRRPQVRRPRVRDARAPSARSAASAT